MTNYLYIENKLGLVGDGNSYEGLRYFYHTDHLGSSSFITDAGGDAVQHLQYLPFGETFIDERTDAQYNTPYKFSGKEKDDETQYSYFGARYYDSDLSVWLSVDPMADKNQGISPYNYCHWNPIVIIDPDGMDDGWYVDENGEIVGRDKHVDDKLYFVHGNDAAKVKADNFNNGVDQSDLQNPVEMPNSEQRDLLSTLYDLGNSDKNQEFGLLIYENAENDNTGGIYYKSNTPFQYSDDPSTYGCDGGLNWSNNEKIGTPVGDSDSPILGIIAHTHNCDDTYPHPPTSFFDGTGSAKTGIVIDYPSGGSNIYIFNSNTRIRSGSKMKAEYFFQPFITPNGRGL